MRRLAIAFLVSFLEVALTSDTNTHSLMGESLSERNAIPTPDKQTAMPEAKLTLTAIGTGLSEKAPEDKGVSVIVMNWDRADTLQNHILPDLNNAATVFEVIVSHGREETKFSTPDLKKVRHLDHWDLNESKGLLRRFYSAKEAGSDCVMHMDDDIFITEDAISKLYLEWRQMPNVVHGYEGRRLHVEGEHVNYMMEWSPPGEVPIVLTQAAMTSKAVNAFALENSSQLDATQTNLEAKPRWNGEDILLSLSSIAFNKKHAEPRNRIYPRIYKRDRSMFDERYDQSAALHNWEGHGEFRTKFSNAVIDFYKRDGVDFSEIYTK